jgi:RNA recognition motif-containing protein
MYVSNLSFHTTEEDIRKLFAEYGDVSSVKLITDRDTGRSRGFAFVEMGSNNEANEAMKNLNNKEIEGRAMSVSVARERENKGGSRNFNRNRW